MNVSDGINDGRVVFEGFSAVRAMLGGVSTGGVVPRTVYRVCFSEERIKSKQYEYSWLSSKCKELDLPLDICTEKEISTLFSSGSGGGILAIASARLPENTEALRCFVEKPLGSPLIFAFEGLEDPYNLGFAIRSAYAFSCNAILLPRHIISGSDNTVCRSSAGASEKMHIFSGNLCELSQVLKNAGYTVCAACEKEALPLSEAPVTLPALIIIGGEKRGISSSLLSSADIRIRIEYARHTSTSLSAANAASIIGYEAAAKNNLLIR